VGWTDADFSPDGNKSGRWKGKYILKMGNNFLFSTERSIFDLSGRNNMTKAEKTRQFIIEQSAPLFNTKGLAGTAMSDVMEATKMAKGGLYGHFESKEELAYAVVDYNLKKLVEKVGEAINKAVSAKEKLFAYLDVFKDPVHFSVEGGCPILNFGVDADDTNAIVREKVKNIMVGSQKRAVAIIQQGIANGEFRESFNAREFAIKMLALIEGGILIGRVLGTNSQMTIIIKMLKKEIGEQAR
jgi:TetR/AcrR family transcriptional repressor of nem operon